MWTELAVADGQPAVAEGRDLTVTGRWVDNTLLVDDDSWLLGARLCWFPAPNEVKHG